jgi:hypothetical protein
MSPLARGLFHKAISQSGTALLKVFITHDPQKVAKVGISPPPGLSKRGQDGGIPEPLFSLQKVAYLAGCNHNSTRIMVDCMRDLSGAQVMRVSKRMVGRTFQLLDLTACRLQPSP